MKNFSSKSFQFFLCVALISWQEIAFSALPPLYNIVRSNIAFEEKVESVAINLVLQDPSERRGKGEGKGIRLIMSREGGVVKILQVLFDDASFNEQKIVGVKQISSLSNLITSFSANDQSQSLKVATYAYFAALGLNTSEYLTQAFYRLSPDMERRESLINKDKHQLLLSYKNYLQEKVKNRKTTMVNPLQPANVEERAMVNRTMEAPYYLSHKKPELVKLHQEFVLFYRLDALRSYFTYNTHHLVMLELGADIGGTSSLELLRYKRLRNGAFVPSEVHVSLKNQIESQFKIESMTPLSGKGFDQRAAEYQQKLSASKYRNDSSTVFPFL